MFGGERDGRVRHRGAQSARNKYLEVFGSFIRLATSVRGGAERRLGQLRLARDVSVSAWWFGVSPS